MSVTEVGLVITRGAVAGGIGTVVMTLGQKLEMAVTGRSPSEVPGQVAAALVGADQRYESWLSTPVHYAHGVAMGSLRGLIGKTGLSGAQAAALFFGLLWSGDALLYKALGVADWPWRWSSSQLATDIGHKAVYALVTSLAFDRLATKAVSAG